MRAEIQFKGDSMTVKAVKRTKAKRETSPNSVRIPAELRLFSDVELEAMGLGSAANRRNLRWMGRDPIPFVRIGRLVKYRLQDVLEYVEKNRVVSG